MSEILSNEAYFAYVWICSATGNNTSLYQDLILRGLNFYFGPPINYFS